MTAEEARNISLKSREIMEEINKAAFEGLTKILIYNPITQIIYEGLINLGYTVKTSDGGRNGTVYKISW